jgi:ElaB/YqjD/DUF883 family membrane-anchored ribosome-binding protein
MSDLEPRARAIVEAGRTADLPSRADHDRIKRAVLLEVAAGTAMAGTATAGTLSLGAKAGLAVLAVTLVGGGAVGVLKLREGDAHPAARVRGAPANPMGLTPAAPTMASPEPAAQAAPVALDPTEDTVDVRKVERVRRAIVAIGRAEKAAELDQLDAEVQVLKRAREELRQRRPERALDALREYDRRFGRGVLAEERQAMAALAGCQAKPGQAARARAEAFLRQAPASPLRERVREACITSRVGISP